MRLRRYRHNRSNTRLSSFKMGKIVPTVSRHCVAGTTLVGGVAAGLQLAPMVHQALSQIRCDTWAISGADRILWQDAEQFYTGGDTGDVRPEVPYIVAPATGWAVGSLADHLGFATGVPNLKCNALPFRLYAFWWNENVRDPQLQDELPISFASGLDTVTNTELQSINWPKDMFTTSTLEQTLGDEVVIPLATNAPVSMSVAQWAQNQYDHPLKASMVPVQSLADSDGIGSNPPMVGHKTVNHSGFSSALISTDGQANVSSNPLPNNTSEARNLAVNVKRIEGTADLTQAAGVLPSDFNFAMARAKWKSRRNLYGTRYKDWLSFLGIRYSDRRLQLPSTLKHGRSMVDISAVLQTAPGTGSSVGESAGRGTSFAACNYKTYFEEPTTVIHLVAVRPAPVYVNMMPPEWQFEVREDIPTPEFMHVGMVEEKVGTLFPTGDPAKDNQRWGFRNRYDECRVGFNDVSGGFKNVNLSYHQGRVFETAPSLNSDFLTCNPSPRIFANMNGDHIEAAAIRNTFVVKDYVTPNGDPRF